MMPDTKVTTFCDEKKVRNTDEGPYSPPTITITANVFFDGTLNNRYNIDYRVNIESSEASNTLDLKKAKEKISKNASYTNNYSNISKLEENFICDSNSFKIYVEGIGSTKDKDDSKMGSGFGLWSSGVKKRVDDSIIVIKKRIEFIIFNKKTAINLCINAFGFSRGAAAARFFCYKIMKSKNSEFKHNSEFNIQKIKFNFLGLFDTVASYRKNHTDNTNALSLDAIICADAVIQLAAADEHRLNFSLTNIKSCKNKKNCHEIFLPGVHSDIGGGYHDEKIEEGLTIFKSLSNKESEQKEALTKEKNKLIENGWYKDSELLIDETTKSLIINKRIVKGYYSIIPLHIMAEYAKEHGLKFKNYFSLKNSFGSGADENTKTFLTKVFDRMITHCIDKEMQKDSSPNDWDISLLKEQDKEMLQQLRHEYLHFSAYYIGDLIGGYIGVNVPQYYYKNNENDDKNWGTDGDFLVYGQRKRRIHDG